MWIGFFAAVSVAILLLLIRAVKGPTVFDRLLAANIVGTNIVVLVVLFGVVTKSDYYVDIALVYAFLNFVATIGFLRFFKYKSFKGK